MYSCIYKKPADFRQRPILGHICDKWY